LANIKSAAKRARQNLKRRELNRYYRNTARTLVKQVRANIATGDLEAAEENLGSTVKALDKAAQKGAIHANNAARRKSRLFKALHKARAATGTSL